MRKGALTLVSFRRTVFGLLVLVLGLIVAGSAGAVTITSWAGGKAAVPAVVTAGGGACPATVVTINGAGFVSDGGVTSVTIGGAPSPQVIVGSDSVLYAVVGAGATSGPVVVTTKAGSATGTNAVVYPCQATAAASAAPTIDSVAPQRAKAGKKLTLSGSGFVGTTSVKIGTEAAAYAIPSDNRLYVKVPADAKSGLLTILVTNNKGTSKVVFQKV